MDGNFSKYLCFHRNFDDFEEFAQIVRQWDLDLRQIDSGLFQTELSQIASQDLQLSKSIFNRKLDQNGSAPKGLRTFAILNNASTPMVWRGNFVDQQKIMVFPQDGELEGSSDPGFDVFTISFTDELLSEVIDIIGVDSTQYILSGSGVRNSDPNKIEEVRKTLSNVLNEITLASPRMTQDQFQYQIEYEIPRALVLALSKGSRNRKKPSPYSRYLALRRVREYIDSNTFEDVTVRDLCKVSGVSERTLRYAFEENLGVSPNNFIKMFRLNRVKRDLRMTDPSDKNISDIANRWGFWHMGQFASDYRKLFGELPSETKRGITVAGF